MQLSTPQRELAADPGSVSRIQVKVVNTGTIIDGLSARLIGADGAEVHAAPAMLPLFPEAEGEFELTVRLPEAQPAGRHPLTVEVVSHTTGAVQHADVDLDVAARPMLGVVREPRMVRARRSGRFVLALTNHGNVPLDVALSSTPGDAGTTLRITPGSLRLEAGTTTSVMAVVRGPRMITGAEVDRTAGIEIVGTPAVTGGAAGPGVPSGTDPGAVPAPTADPAVEGDPALTHSTTVQLRQRPLISRGLLTFLILASVVALWAAIFLFGLINVFAGDPLTKTAPASFFAASTGGTGGTDGAGGAGGGPADALPKNGLLPPGVGGQIGGTVTARSDDSPVGRILVEAYRSGRDGRLVKVSSGATQSDGSYTLAGLFPTSYRLKFSATGYDTVWYGGPGGGEVRGGGQSAPGGGGGRADAQEILAEAQGTVDGIDVVIGGQVGSISGKVDPGDSLVPVATTVSARLLSSAADAPPAATTTTDGAGGYVLTGLQAPGTYELSFVAEGYRPTTVTQKLAGGENRIQPTVLLSAGGGQISGIVRGGAGPLGGVTVTTTVDGEAVSVMTPTVGSVGTYALQNLPTPGTYVLTFTAEGHGSRTETVALDPGESRTGFDQSLTAGTGSVSGVVRGAAGGIGGVTVVVGGAVTTDGKSPSTTTLTTGKVGGFAFSDLPAPGDYTLTVTAPGYAPETRPFSLSADGPAATVDLQLTTQLGDLRGKVTRSGGGLLDGVTVTVSSGTETFRTTSSGRGGALPNGGFLFAGLKPGWYSVTATMPGWTQQTGLVRIRAGKDAELDLVLEEAG
ncbi:carboxypeptidase-like regulatory domain-containing protein [Nocardioides sp. L-11A]|uniref:carboxypeptidase-like regulatory domain-containing protein n=1 Tax=Nocardioides sp. L-11A TaxID=3043848 RepID=UPI00249C9FD1|nr:carboxypeptidase-like regulatory domain-containing protein [Nocardioides sp. L-11A]